MKRFFWTFVAVAAGIYIYLKLTGRKIAPGGTLTFGPLTITPVGAGVYYGPDVDPVTGAYLNPGALPGTVEFNAQGN